MNRGNYVSRGHGGPSTASRGKLVTKWQGNIGNSLLLGACLLFALPRLRTRAEVVAKEARGGTGLTINVKLFFVRRCGSFVPTSGSSQEATWLPRRPPGIPAKLSWNFQHPRPLQLPPLICDFECAQKASNSVYIVL